MTYKFKDFVANKNQQEAIMHSLAPLMILASAGTGKTATILHRIVYMVTQKNIDPSSILIITYTEKAAQELKDRIKKLIDIDNNSMNVTTFHGLCLKIVKEFGQKKGDYALIKNEELAYQILEKFDDLGPFKSREFKKNPLQAITQSFLPFFDRLHDELLTLDRLPNGQLIYDEEDKNYQLEDLIRSYPIVQDIKKSANRLDYGDMILSAHQLLSSNENILSKVQNKYQHLIIDEFQDNNHSLNAISALIAKKTNSITVVGDEDQVIYSFRGASIYNIQHFRSNYGNHKNFKEITLSKNYRSNQQIIDLANASISNNSERTEKKLYSNLSSSAKRPILAIGDKPQQNQYIVDEIKRLIANGYHYHQIAILCRTHNQSIEAENHLKMWGIPVEMKIPYFFELNIVKELISWCLVTGGGPNQDVAFFKLLEQNAGLDTASDFFNGFSKKDSSSRLEIALNKDDLKSKKFKSLCDSIRFLQNYNHPRNFKFARSAEETFNKILEKTGILYSHSKRYSFYDKVSLLNAAHFSKMIQDYVSSNSKKNSLKHFNSYIDSLMTISKDRAKYPDQINKSFGVTIDTIHGSKGKEYPIVFIPYNRSGSFPLNFTSKKILNRPPQEWMRYLLNTNLNEKEFHLEEERRLFYVAITRSKEKLYLLSPAKAMSRMVKELPEYLMERIKIKENSNQKEIPFSGLHLEYNQILQESVASNDFSLARAAINSIERLNSIKKGLSVKWGSNEWEIELKKKLTNVQKHETKLDQINLSASAIDQYEQCPLKYRFSSIDRIPQSSGKPALTFGNIMHRVLQRFHSPAEDYLEKDLLQLLDEEWDNSGFFYKEQENEFKIQGKEILSRYFVQNADKNDTIIAREEKFSFMINNITVNGVIDRIDNTIEGQHVIDYKTNNTPSSAKSSMQLAIYSMFLNSSGEMNQNGQPVKASLYFLRLTKDPMRSHIFSKEELEIKKSSIIEVANNITNNNFEPKKGKHCDWCDYKNYICPEWQK